MTNHGKVESDVDLSFLRIAHDDKPHALCWLGGGQSFE